MLLWDFSHPNRGFSLKNTVKCSFMNLNILITTAQAVKMMVKGLFKIEQKRNLFMKSCVANKRTTNALSICSEFKALSAMESRLDLKV